MNRPTAAPAHFPYTEHRTLAEAPILPGNGTQVIKLGWWPKVSRYQKYLDDNKRHKRAHRARRAG